MRDSTILVVIPDPQRREQVGSWLDGEAHVVPCPGPQDEACLGLRGPTCPLAASADLVVLDMGESDDPFGGTVAGWELLNAYQDQGLPVIALGRPGDLMMTGSRQRILPLDRSASREEVVEAAGRILRSETSA